MGSDGAVVFILVIIAIVFIAVFLDSGKPAPPPCDFCKNNDIIIVYRENHGRERCSAKFCPKCGRKLPD